MREVNGGCLCGAVRYRLEGDPAMVAVCHCTTCQKNSGSAFSINIVMPEEGVEITGESLATYIEQASADSKPFFRSFCFRCGSPISGHGEAYRGVIFVKAGTLDDPYWVRPTQHIWRAEKQPWVEIREDQSPLAAGP